MRKKHPLAPWVILCLAGVLTAGCRTSAPGSVGELQSPGGLVELVAQRKVSATARGSGMEYVDLELQRVDAGVEAVDIPAGTYFVAQRAAVQDMVATSTQTIRLSGNGWLSVRVPGAAATLDKARPVTGDTFQIQSAPLNEDLRRLVTVLATAALPYPVRQAAVWITTDDASYDQMGTVVRGYALSTARVIDDSAMAEALQLCERAGIDVTRKAIWHQRNRILNGLPEGPIKDWLAGGAGRATVVAKHAAGGVAPGRAMNAARRVTRRAFPWEGIWSFAG